tara:strand:+ start:935 stop:1534 length:600 start_codon:yes stop_codon:yes gene_type:complete
MASVLKVDKLDPQSGTALEIGTSGDTINVPSGVTLDINSGATLDATGATITGALANTPAWLVYLGSNQTLTNATETKVQFGTEAFDTDGVYDNATDYDVTIPSGKGGKYFIEAASFFDDCDAGQYSSLKLYKNGADYTTPRFFSQVSGAASADNVFPEFSGVIELAAADTISIYAYQNSGGDGNLRAYWCKFSGYKLIG